MGCDGHFCEWWAQYPRHVARGYARKCWEKLWKAGVIHEGMIPDMMKALDWQRREWAKSDPQFIPHPSTYLNQERWTDEPIAKAAAPVMPRFTGTDEHIGACERVWRKNPSLSRAETEDLVQRERDLRSGRREPSNLTHISDIVKKALEF